MLSPSVFFFCIGGWSGEEGPCGVHLELLGPRCVALCLTVGLFRWGLRCAPRGSCRGCVDRLPPVHPCEAQHVVGQCTFSFRCPSLVSILFHTRALVASRRFLMSSCRWMETSTACSGHESVKAGGGATRPSWRASWPLRVRSRGTAAGAGPSEAPDHDGVRGKASAPLFEWRRSQARPCSGTATGSS